MKQRHYKRTRDERGKCVGTRLRILHPTPCQVGKVQGRSVTPLDGRHGLTWVLKLEPEFNEDLETHSHCGGGKTDFKSIMLDPWTGYVKPGGSVGI